MRIQINSKYDDQKVDDEALKKFQSIDLIGGDRLNETFQMWVNDHKLHPNSLSLSHSLIHSLTRQMLINSFLYRSSFLIYSLDWMARIILPFSLSPLACIHLSKFLSRDIYHTRTDSIVATTTIIIKRKRRTTMIIESQRMCHRHIMKDNCGFII